MEFKNFVDDDKFFQDDNGKIYTRKEFNEYMRDLAKREQEIMDRKPKLSRYEQGYRKGYLHGFSMCLRGNYTEDDMKELRNWGTGWDLTGPPFSPLAGVHLDGLTEDDEHRFFANRLSQNWNDPK